MALLSDGTDVEATLPAAAGADGVLRGVGAAAGRVTGPARVIHDPATAHIEPGEILVAATTDPGWTPLFLTAAALVTETGAIMAHGPTVAREYGIPAVISVPGRDPPADHHRQVDHRRTARPGRSRPDAVARPAVKSSAPCPRRSTTRRGAR